MLFDRLFVCSISTIWVRESSSRLVPLLRVAGGSRANRLRVGDGHLNLYTGFDVDRGDLLDDLRWRVQIDDTLVQAHLEAIPSLGTLTARGLTGGDTQNLGRHADGALDTQLLLLGSADQISANLLQTADIARGQRDANAVYGRGLGNGLLNVLSSGGHFSAFR